MNSTDKTTGALESAARCRYTGDVAPDLSCEARDGRERAAAEQAAIELANQRSTGLRHEAWVGMQVHPRVVGGKRAHHSGLLRRQVVEDQVDIALADSRPQVAARAVGQYSPYPD